MGVDPDYTGECLCGAVKLKVYGDPKWVGHCHCPSCQKVSGTGFASYAGFDKTQVSEIIGPLKTYKSAASVKRSYCSECGCPVSFEGEAWPNETHIHLSILDKAAELHPIGDAHIKTRMPWVHLEDGLIKFADFPT